jgi:hypothetical protein
MAVPTEPSAAAREGNAKAHPGSATKPVSGSPAVPEREQVLAALLRARLPHPDRILIHYSHTCDLELDAAHFPVIDLRELVKNVNVPRGYNRIVVFRPDWTVFREVEYTDQRPLYCRGNELFVYDEMQASLASGPERGNVLVFSEDVEEYRLRTVSVLGLPTLREQQQPKATKKSR